MKKLFVLILMLMLLCSCGNEPFPEVTEEPSEENLNVSEEEKILQLWGDIDGFEIYTESFTEGKRQNLKFNSINTPNLEEGPNTEYLINDSEGNVLIEQPFDYCELFAPVNMYSHPDYYTISGSHDGDIYKFIYKDGKFEEWIFEPAGETGEIFFDCYKLTRYCRNTEDFYYGINDFEGNIVFEPIYARIEVPFSDRFILYEGGPGMFNNSGEGKCRIATAANQKLAEYTYVTYKFFDDDSYIGIANVAGGGAVPCFDENGNILKNGYYFVDKNGKIISERFLSLFGNGENIFAVSSPEDIITGTDEKGNPVEFKLGDFTIKSGAEFLDMAEEKGIFSKKVETGGTRKDIVLGKDGAFSKITEVPEIEYWITDIEGNKMIDHPFYDFEFWNDENHWGFDRSKPGIHGCYKGSWYRYYFEEGKYKLAESEKAGEVERWPFYNDSKIFDGFVPTVYYYGAREYCFGLNDKSWNVILEPIFTYIPNLPFEDRITVTVNNRDRMDGWEAFETLMDFDKNAICTYTGISFHHFDDGSYIGIAWYGGFGENTGHLLRDKNGEILETGHRFIDKNGNVLSPCFDLFSLCGNEDEFIEEYLHKTAVFTDDKGGSIEINIKDYIQKE
ncbi:MAG: hypothetical protein IKL57_01200 [Oscillospiraceae bacterium]|nr:hypothetical protein [Oscillospiraceae bacterium]